MFKFSDMLYAYGVVEDVQDPLQRGRVRVRLVGLHTEDKALVPTDALPWSNVALDTSSASISGVGSSPVGLVPGSLVSGVCLDQSGQQFQVWFVWPGMRAQNKNPTIGFNDPSGMYPILGAENDINPRAQGVDIQDNPMEDSPFNDDVNDQGKPVNVPNVTGKYFSIEDYFMGRDKAYPSQLKPDYITNATETVQKVNALLDIYYKANPNARKTKVNSGWRPPAINSATPGAATRSNHLICKAVDMGDADGAIDLWCNTAAGKRALEEVGLWMESYLDTPRWAHFQTVPPRSGARYFRAR